MFDEDDCENEGCPNPQSRTNFCEQCQCVFCDQCWLRQAAHKPGKKAQDGAEHVRSNRRVQNLLEKIFEGPTSDELGRLLDEDSTTLWFGHSIDTRNGEALFHDYKRFPALMQACGQDGHSTKYPHLVTFVGDTGDGKSTLVKTLIQLALLDRPEDLEATPTPVIGSKDNHRPTTSSVHLYLDPQNAAHSQPILFADCEGFRGGDSAPVTEDHRAKQTSNTLAAPPPSRSREDAPSGFKYEISKAIRGRTRKIAWASNSDMKRREFAVTQLYPKLLYIFSDVVVFVLKGLRTFEVVLLQMISWGAESLEGSLNQPVLPHAIFVSNYTDASIDDDQWDVSKATDSLLSQFQHIRDAPKFRELQQKWAKSGVVIDSLQDLLYRYYSSVSVIRVPTRGRYMKIEEQIQKLRSKIEGNCQKAFQQREKARLLLNSDALQMYLEAAFEHFSQNLDSPFDFLSAAIHYNPISSDLSHNIVRLARCVLRDPGHSLGSRSGPGWVFERLAKLVASCIFLDIVRKGLPGEAERAFKVEYLKPCDEALERFMTHFWPCSYRRSGSQCVNAASSHTKGHQDINGRVFYQGDYLSEHSFEKYVPDWHLWIKNALQEISHQDLDGDSSSSLSSGDRRTFDMIHTYRIHQEKLQAFHQLYKSALALRSQTTCLSCLTEFPEHPLPCGHVICTHCIRAWGSNFEGSDVLIDSCPIEGRGTRIEEKCLIHIKPPLAGTRVLCLDGEGTRAISELLVLKELSKYLPRDVKIQNFFDLIVGTGAGGIIALGLGVKDWDLDEATENFKKFCYDGFKPRVSVRSIGLLSGGSIYKTEPLKRALQRMLGTAKLFGGFQNGLSSRTRVAVISTGNSGHQPVIFANYNRRQTPRFQKDECVLVRSEYSVDEVELWEAGRATFAIPLLFTPFTHHSGKIYLAGLVQPTSPIFLADNERKLLWPNNGGAPDVFLSIGSGTSLSTNSNQSSSKRNKPFQPGLQLSDCDLGLNSRHYWRRFLRIGTFGKHIKAIEEQINDSFSANVAWTHLRSNFTNYHTFLERYHRVNVQQIRMHAVDDSECIEDLVEDTSDQLSRRHRRSLQEIALRLVATQFYFERVTYGRDLMTEDRFMCKGYIRCRFSDRSPELRKLSTWLRELCVFDFTPYFCITATTLDDDGIIHKTAFPNIEIEKSALDAMFYSAHFELPEVEIRVSGEEVKISIMLAFDPEIKYPISGFPMPFFASPEPTSSQSIDDIGDIPFAVIDDDKDKLSPEISSKSAFTNSFRQKKAGKSVGFWNETLSKITAGLRWQNVEAGAISSEIFPDVLSDSPLLGLVEADSTEVFSSFEERSRVQRTSPTESRYSRSMQTRSDAEADCRVTFPRITSWDDFICLSAPFDPIDKRASADSSRSASSDSPAVKRDSASPDVPESSAFRLSTRYY